MEEHNRQRIVDLFHVQVGIKKIFTINQAQNSKVDRFRAFQVVKVLLFNSTKYPAHAMMLGVVGSDGKRMKLAPLVKVSSRAGVAKLFARRAICGEMNISGGRVSV